MRDNSQEVARRTNLALIAIGRALEENDGEVPTFFSHHIEEIGASYWRKHLGVAKPTPKQALSLLVLRSHWGPQGDDGIDTFDFTLPDGVTNYVIAVKFDEDGTIRETSMES